MESAGGTLNFLNKQVGGKNILELLEFPEAYYIGRRTCQPAAGRTVKILCGAGFQGLRQKPLCDCSRQRLHLRRSAGLHYLSAGRLPNRPGPPYQYNTLQGTPVIPFFIAPVRARPAVCRRTLFQTKKDYGKTFAKKLQYIVCCGAYMGIIAFQTVFQVQRKGFFLKGGGLDMESAGGTLNFLNKQVGGKNILGAFSGQRLRNGACRHFRYD